MPLVQFDIANIGDLDDGRVSVAFAHELRRAVMDCMDRPGDKKPRSVTLEFRLTPVVGEEGQCDGAEGEFEIKSKVPTRKSKTYSFSTNRKGHLIYSSNNPEDIDQATFDDVDPATGNINRKRKETD
jgi:hypothetical protein